MSVPSTQGSIGCVKVPCPILCSQDIRAKRLFGGLARCRTQRLSDPGTGSC